MTYKRNFGHAMTDHTAGMLEFVTRFSNLWTQFDFLIVTYILANMRRVNWFIEPIWKNLNTLKLRARLDLMNTVRVWFTGRVEISEQSMNIVELSNTIGLNKRLTEWLFDRIIRSVAPRAGLRSGASIPCRYRCFLVCFASTVCCSNDHVRITKCHKSYFYPL